MLQHLKSNTNSTGEYGYNCTNLAKRPFSEIIVIVSKGMINKILHFGVLEATFFLFFFFLILFLFCIHDIYIYIYIYIYI
jgi:hypothetical protein